MRKESDSTEGQSTEILSETADVLINIISDSEIIDNVPWVGGVSKLLKLGTAISDKLFMKKLARFLFSIKSVPTNDRQQFIRELQKADVVENVGETLLLIIDKFEESRK